MNTTDRASVHVVTDSTASLPAGAHAGLGVVPLQVIAGPDAFLEAVEITVDDVARRLERGVRLTTSQPTPAAFAQAYADAAEAGARSVVSVHLSGELSGTVHAAALAAAQAPVPVRVVDSRTVGMALGFAALAAAERAREGAGADDVARLALRVADSSRAVFMVDSLDHLRRGGRLSAASAALGTVLGVRPLLAVRGGRIEVVQKVRTRTAAVDRMVQVALDSAARRREPLLAVHHLGDDTLARMVAERLEPGSRSPVEVTAVSAVLGAHVGPGVLAVVVADGAPAPR